MLAESLLSPAMLVSTALSDASKSALVLALAAFGVV